MDETISNSLKRATNDVSDKRFKFILTSDPRGLSDVGSHILSEIALTCVMCKVRGRAM